MTDVANPEDVLVSESPVLVESEPLKSFTDEGAGGEQAATEATEATESAETESAVDCSSEEQNKEDQKADSSALPATPVQQELRKRVDVDEGGPRRTALSVLSEAGPLLLWHDSVRTGTLFFSVLSFLYLTQVAGYSVVTLAAYALMAVVGVVGVLSRAAPLMPAVLNVEKRVADLRSALAAADSKVECLAADVAARINELSGWVLALTTDGSLKDQLYFLLALYVVASVGSWFSTTTLCLVTFVSAFLVPVAYDRNQIAADQAYVNAQSEINVAYVKARQAASPLIAQGRDQAWQAVERVRAATPWKKAKAE